MLHKPYDGEDPYLASCYHAAHLRCCGRENGRLSVCKGHFIPFIPIHPLDIQNLNSRYRMNFNIAYKSQNKRAQGEVSAPEG